MCGVTLTVLPSCKHELPTIDYCQEASEAISIYRSKRQLGVTTEPAPNCTESLGWMIFKRLEAPVKCEGCKMWLWINGKQTYGSIMEEQGPMDIKTEEGAVLFKEEIEIDEDKLEEARKLVKRAKRSASKDTRKLGDEELQKLMDNISRR